MKYKGKPNTVEYIYFRFVAWNLPNLHSSTKLVMFKFNNLLIKGLMQTVIYEKIHSKKQQKRDLAIQIMTSQISVMRLDLNAETKYKHINRILK